MPDIKRDSSGFYYAGETSDMKYVLQTMQVRYVDSARKNNWSNLYAYNSRPVVNVRPVNKNSIPDVKGMGLKDALYLLENMDLKVVTKGKGKVITQFPEPGTVLNDGQTILIELN